MLLALLSSVFLHATCVKAFSVSEFHVSLYRWSHSCKLSFLHFCCFFYFSISLVLSLIHPNDRKKRSARDRLNTYCAIDLFAYKYIRERVFTHAPAHICTCQLSGNCFDILFCTHLKRTHTHNTSEWFLDIA